MSRVLLTGNGAAAWGARLANTDYVPAFPITPQTEIIETIAAWIDQGAMDARLVMMDSEHSMITAAGAAAATGVRAFTATSSQGLLYGMEMLYTVAGWRVPYVLVNVSRGLASPITLEPDHNDVLAARDSGAVQIHCATCQEVLDNTLMAFRLAEHPRVRVPVIVNLDGFYLSFTREPVEILDAEAASRFVGPFEAGSLRFRASQPLSQAVAALGGSLYSYFRYEAHLAVLAAADAYRDIAQDFAESFGRKYAAVEAYRTDDAEFVFVMMGSFATKARDAVDRLRADGWRIGLLRPRLLRPFPVPELRQSLAGKAGVAIIDQNLSMGKGGVLHMEVTSALYDLGQRAPVVASFVGGLGGRDISASDFRSMAEATRRAAVDNKPPPPRLLYTESELREVRKLQAVAAVEREEIERRP